MHTNLHRYRQHTHKLTNLAIQYITPVREGQTDRKADSEKLH